MARLPRNFYLRSTARVAKELLGKTLCVHTPHGIARSRIVETEAYLGVKDRACHTFGGRRTARTEAMYLQGGHVYVYFIYGMHFCLNVTTRASDVPEAVLIRAVEPVDEPVVKSRAARRTNGPGKLCRYYGIDRADNGLDVTSKASRIWIEESKPSPRPKIRTTARIGIDSTGEARDLPLRYFISENPYVSGKLK